MQEINFRHDILPLKNKLFRLALRITMDSAEAEDIVQDTMIKVWSHREELAALDSVEAYCLTICRNLAIDRSQLKGAQTEELTEQNAAQPDASDPYSRFVQNEQMEIIHRLINALPEKQRTIVQLRDVEGKSYKEIAEILQLSEEQVKVNLFRARQKIKQQFTEINNYGL